MKYRAFDNGELIYSDDLGLRIFWLRAVNLDIMLYSELEDKNGDEFWCGDIRRYKGKLYKVRNEGWRFTLVRTMMDCGENETIVVDEDVVWLSELIGTIYTHKVY